MDSLEEKFESLADSWAPEDAGVMHVRFCSDFGCKTCVVIACATDVRAVLRGER